MATNYDPKKVIVNVGGQVITEFMDGTFVTTEKNEDNVIPHVGADGTVTYSESADETGTITITVKQTSASLPHLRRLATQKTQFPTQIIDRNTRGVRTGGNECRILRNPGNEYGAEVAGVEFQIHVSDFTVK